MTKKHALLIALASALTLGAVTTSFAQESGRYGYTRGYNNQYGYDYTAPRESDSGYAGPSAE
jgi:hypothetical protein